MRTRALVVGSVAGFALLAYACTIRDITEVPVASVSVEPSTVTLLEGETQGFSAQARDEAGNGLPTGAVTWSSDDPGVFSISSEGEGEALSAGQTTVRATLEGTRGSATILVEPGPRLLVDRQDVAFFGSVGGQTPEPVTLTLTNGGGGTLGGITASVDYPQGKTAGWLSVALTGTSAPTTLTLSVLVGLLEAGTYDADLILTSPDARNGPVAIPISIQMTLDQPIIQLSPASLQFPGVAGGTPPPAQTIRVTNGGGGTLSGLQAEALYLGQGGWLSVDLSATSAPATITVQPNPSGLSPGDYSAEVRVTGEGALNSPRFAPVTLTVEVGVVSSVNSTADVPNGTAGTPTNILVQARDAAGNPINAGGEDVRVSVSGANTVAAFQATDNGDGTYSASYTPAATGADHVAITINGIAIGGSPFLSQVGSGNASPSNSTAVVPNGSAGSATDIVVQARDSEGNPVDIGGETVEVTVSGANNPGSLNVTDEGDGTYTAGYTPSNAGIDNVAITMNGVAISGSPYTSFVGTGGADPATSTAAVPDGTAGEVTDILIQARDDLGNALGSGGETVEVEVSGANTVAAFSATDNGDGTYSAGYTPTVAGVDNVAITLNGTAIGGSPYASTVSPGPADPASSTATVPNGTAGNPTDIVVQARDAFGNPLAAGGETVEISVSGANNPGALVVTDVGDGTYTASYTPLSTGDDSVVITMNGTGISGSPFTSSVSSGVVSPAQSTASVPDGGVGAATNIVVQARDSEGNAIATGGATVLVEVSGANTVAPFAATDVGDGTYTASYIPVDLGDDDIAITMNGTPISGSPFTSTVGVGPADPASSTASVPDGEAGLVTDIVVQARDAGGNALSGGGESVVVNVTGANNEGDLTVTDEGDGTYTASYTPLTASPPDDEIVITMNGTPISGSPFSSTVDLGDLDEASSTATVPNGTVGEVTEIVVQARDVGGNALGHPAGLGATVVVNVTGANTENDLVAGYNNDGTYTATYIPTTAGTDNVAITMNTITISGSPYTSSVGVGDADPTQSTATVPDGTVGSVTSITIQARDSGGNPVGSGGEAVEVQVGGANTVNWFSANDNGDGTYTATYSPQFAGTDEIDIEMNGTPISGSPFTSEVSPGAPVAANSTATVPDGQAGSVTNIVVQARDAGGNDLTTGGATVTVTVSGDNPAGALAVNDEGDGTYTASYTPTVAGTDNVAITLGGSAISGSPYSSAVDPDVVDGSNSTASVPDGQVGVATDITVQARDQYGNDLTTGGAAVVVNVTGANNEGNLAVNDEGDGTYTASYTPGADGDDTVTITVAGQAVIGSPFTSTVAAALAGANLSQIRQPTTPPLSS